MLSFLFFFFLIDCCGLCFLIRFLLGHGALVKLFPLKHKWKISAIYLFWCIYCNYICNSFYLTDFYFLLKEAKGKINSFWDWSIFSGEIENASSKLLRRRLWQKMSALAFVETLWNMQQWGDKTSFQTFYNQGLEGRICSHANSAHYLTKYQLPCACFR